MACSGASDAPVSETPAPTEIITSEAVSSETASSATTGSDLTGKIEVPAAGAVEIALIDKLHGVTSEYCIDIAGGNKDVDIGNGLQAHTCYSYRGAIGSDQSFVTAKFAQGQLYMTDFDVCATASALSAGAAIGLASCEGSDLQKIAFSGSGAISMAASPELCFTAAKDTRFGRSKAHQIKVLSLETCSDALAPYQQWYGRESAEVGG